MSKFLLLYNYPAQSENIHRTYLPKEEKAPDCIILQFIRAGQKCQAYRFEEVMYCCNTPHSASASSIAAATRGSSGRVSEVNRALTLPFFPMMNFSKFHCIGPLKFLFVSSSVRYL